MLDETALELISDELQQSVVLIREGFTHLVEGRPRTALVWFSNCGRRMRAVRDFVNHSIKDKKPKRNDEPGGDEPQPA
jgi:hypothetical protein